ncbi:hypothetical protein CEXT_287751 [Caerostris extrusa]|uniref:Uncharacterized protein n=1 Tax=Caerostris extrusa TaxID=172846 RepID=A0AAV4N4N5_CAEEX|nr:hypothetical protein CEXT_287751 [Caerostris extrusa]
MQSTLPERRRCRLINGSDTSYLLSGTCDIGDDYANIFNKRCKLINGSDTSYLLSGTCDIGDDYANIFNKDAD